ncbi:DUF6779 domain-containing protein [Corynebacterium dentalis]|uniref:DUF6779 domain-containing protein n=1 Tax=Corynebacterium dentalis TaxID=2014528 RepID=UPI000C07F3B5|nr:DUF6779 domain-containing protein [Corynebacterium dentalis]
MSFQPQPQHDRQARPSRELRDESSTRDRSGDSRRGSAEQGEGRMSKLLMFGLLILAVVASLLMLFMDSDFWLKIAVIAALWAAVLGAILVSRYSSALTAERDRNRQMQRMHTSELRREKSEHQQREAMLESSYEQRMRDQRDEHLEQLRQELVVLRSQLTSLTGRDYGEEQASVHARAERVRELGGTSTPPAQPQSAPVPDSKPAASAASRPAAASASSAASSAAPKGKHGKATTSFSTGSFAAVRWDGQDTQETTQLPLVVDTTAMEDEPKPSAPASSFGTSASKSASAPATVSAPAAATPSADTAAHSRHSAPLETSHTGGRRRADAAESAAPQKPAGQGGQGGGRRRKKEEDAQDTAHGRRRADESGGLTVAELMARFKEK